MASLLLLTASIFGVIFFIDTFSQTNVPQFTYYASSSEPLRVASQQEYILPEPYLDSEVYPASELKKEISRLFDLAKERNETEVEQHKQEYSDLMKIPISNEATLGDYIGFEKRPLSNEVFRVLRNDLDIYIAKEKIKYNVARPEHINVALNSPVAIPDSPSYPSQFAADATLAALVASLYVDEEAAEKIMTAVEAAIVRTHKVGISTKFDTEYGARLAREYFSVMNTENLVASSEFVLFTNEIEWSDRTNTLQGRGDVDNLSDLKVIDTQYTNTPTGVYFNATLLNQGVRTPTPLEISLELDRFADGSIDQTIPITYGGLDGGALKQIGYYLDLDWTETGRFRFVVNPQPNFIERYHYNNYGDWTPFPTLRKIEI